MDPPPLDGPRTPEELQADAGQTITEDGLGGQEALRLFAEVLAPATISVDHPRSLSYIPGAPSEASILFDLVVGASSIYGGSWHEGAGAVFAENQALRWLADLAGLPPEAGGVFVQGGTNGNLSALVAARARGGGASRRGGRRAGAWPPASSAHSSVRSSAELMDADVLVGADAGLSASPAMRSRRSSTRRAPTTCSPWSPPRAAPTSASSTTSPASRAWPSSTGSGSTSTARTGPPRWRHPRHGTCSTASSAATRSPSTRTSGSSRPSTAARCSTATRCGLGAPTPRRPSTSTRCRPCATGTRRTSPSTSPGGARGLPFWFSLATHGTRAYTEAIEQTLATARGAAAEIASREELELIREPDLSVVGPAPSRLGRGRLRRVVGEAARRRHRLRGADQRRRDAGDAHGHRQPAHHARRHPPHPGLAAGLPLPAVLSAPPDRSTAGASTRAPRIQITPPTP